MQLDRRICDRARRSRDARFDGKFFIAVTSTRIYCRPICPARSPKDEHIRYYPTAAAAEAAGFRPCLRCRPEASPGTPAWSGTMGVVSRALRLIADGVLDRDGVEGLADRVGMTDRHLRRLFVEHLGAAPLEIALTRRVQFAKKLLDETRLPCAEIAVAAGFGSVRRFNAEIRRTYSRTPTDLRRLSRRKDDGEDRYRFRLAYRPPYDWNAIARFLQSRATPGVEWVDERGYSRTISVNNTSGSISIAPGAEGTHLAVEVHIADSRALLMIIERVRRMFDTAADPAAIAAQLSDPLLRPALAAHPGIRLPGAWDAFELTVRAILGQQISVAGATTLAGRIAARWGTRINDQGPLTHVFPTAAQLCEARFEDCGVTGARSETLRQVARAVRDDRVRFDDVRSLPALGEISGIGDWTTAYVAMRAFNEPDAFPAGDLVLRRMAGDLTSRELERRSEAWRPWRAYAVMLLWQEATDGARPRRSQRVNRAQSGLHQLGATLGRAAFQ